MAELKAHIITFTTALFIGYLIGNDFALAPKQTLNNDGSLTLTTSKEPARLAMSPIPEAERFTLTPTANQHDNKPFETLTDVTIVNVLTESMNIDVTDVYELYQASSDQELINIMLELLAKPTLSDQLKVRIIDETVFLSDGFLTHSQVAHILKNTETLSPNYQADAIALLTQTIKYSTAGTIDKHRIEQLLAYADSPYTSVKSSLVAGLSRYYLQHSGVKKMINSHLDDDAEQVRVAAQCAQLTHSKHKSKHIPELFIPTAQLN